MHVGIEIDFPTSLSGKVSNLLGVAFPGFIWEVEVYPEHSFVRVGSDTIEVWYLFKSLAGEGESFALCHASHPSQPTGGSDFLAGGNEVEVPTCLGQELLLCILQSFGVGVSHVIYHDRLLIQVERWHTIAGESCWQ